jgi:hypothetical protein
MALVCVGRDMLDDEVHALPWGILSMNAGREHMDW